MMNILLHVCCGPCACYPVEALRSEGVGVTGYWFNHNIHPLTEYRKRLDAARTFAGMVSLDLIVDDEYLLETFLENVSSDPSSRCRYCYRSRLERVARAARERGFSHFSSTLLYSRYQNHEMIRALGEAIAAETGVPFHYADFRPGWHEGIRRSRELGLYRQQYCGCIYSERDRYLAEGKQSR